jgi:hypothetical protein
VNDFGFQVMKIFFVPANRIETLQSPNRPFQTYLSEFAGCGFAGIIPVESTGLTGRCQARIAIIKAPIEMISERIDVQCGLRNKSSLSSTPLFDVGTGNGPLIIHRNHN